MKGTKEQKAITLIALIITIVVLLILAAVAISSITNDGILQYAQNAAKDYNQAITNEKAQLQDYLHYLEESFGEPLSHGGIIPTGGRYTQANGTVLNAGEEFPNTITEGDVYIYGDYQYHFNQQYNSTTSGWDSNSAQDGWGVRVLDDTKEEYEKIIESINGKYITNLYEAFQKCYSLKTAPAIPKGVNYMAYTFAGCESLIDISKIIIPEIALDIHGAFNWCTSLEKIPTLVIPETVTRVDKLFFGCEALVDVSPLILNNGVKRADGMFRECYALKIAPKEIPSSVENMTSMFMDCLNLECNIAINANPTNYSLCFSNVDMTKITFTGSTSTMLDAIGATGLNYKK